MYFLFCLLARSRRSRDFFFKIFFENLEECENLGCEYNYTYVEPEKVKKDEVH